VSISDNSQSRFMGNRAVNDYQVGSHVIYRRVTALVMASAHIAIACHFLAALHFSGSHRGVRQAGQRESKRPNRNKNQGNNTPVHHRFRVTLAKGSRQVPCIPSSALSNAFSCSSRQTSSIFIGRSVSFVLLRILSGFSTKALSYPLSRQLS